MIWLVFRSGQTGEQNAKDMGPAVLYWVVQRSALTGALITFVSFGDYADAERHKAELEAIVDPLDRVSLLAIESLPIGEFPKTQNKRGGRPTGTTQSSRTIREKPAPCR